eukprot:jgi/Tetstr1/428088/TSEL_018143.t1
MRRGIQVDLSEVNDSIAELEEQLAIDVEAIESSLASTDSNVEGLSNTVTAAAPAVSSLEDDLVALSNFTHDCCDEAAAERLERKKISQKKWRDKNTERIREYRAGYDSANRERVREYHREYYRANAEHVRKRQRKRYHRRVLA